MKKTEIVLLILALLLGIFLRMPEVLNRNPIFGFDQGRDYLAVRKIVVDKKPTLIGSEVGAGMAGLQYIFHGPYYYYFLVVPFILFGGDPYGGIVLMFILGITSLALFFLIVKEIFGVKSALVGLFLIDLALYAQSRFVWNSHPSTPLILLVFWFVYKIPQTPKRFFFLAAFFAGIIYGFQLAISVVLIMAIFIYLLFILRIKDFKVYFWGLAGAILAYLPFIAFEFRHGFMAFRGLVRLNLLNTSNPHLLAFWFNFRDSFYLSDKARFWLFILLFLTAIYFLVKEKRSSEKNFIIFLLTLPLVTFVIFMPLDSVVWGHYLIHLHLVYIFLFAYFLIKSKKQVFRLLLGVFLILMLPSISKEIIKAKNDLADYGGVAKMKGKLEAIDYIYQDAGNQKFNVLVFTPPVYDYAYQYLLTWYGQKKYGYIPGNKKEGLFYLWIEPDSKKPWSYNGWLETVIKTGKVLKEEKLPSGFIIQKRYEEK